jgi:AraC-like DNA-binding protein
MDRPDGESRPFAPDPLTIVLEGLRLRFMLPGVSEMSAPWGIQYGAMSKEAIREHVTSMGLTPPPWDPPTVRGSVIAVLRGHCQLEVDGEPAAIPLAGGDLAIITRPGPFVLRDDPASPVVSFRDVIRREHIERKESIRFGGGGAATTLLNGPFFFEDDHENPLLASLPAVIQVRGEQGRAVPWLSDTVRFIVHELENRTPGGDWVVGHLTHVLFVQAVRAHFASLHHHDRASWFSALTDPDVGPALGAIHLKPDVAWTVASLAEQTSLSRSAFAAKFMTVVGRPPLQYLTDCRMRKARDLLRQEHVAIKSVASRVGYATESAFSNAFKRHTGTAPGAFRKAALSSRPH